MNFNRTVSGFVGICAMLCALVLGYAAEETAVAPPTLSNVVGTVAPEITARAILTNANVLVGTNGLSGLSLARAMDPETLAAMMNSLDEKQRLGAGDKVSYRVIEDQDPAVPLVVGDSGDLDIPYLGLVGAVNKTCRQLASEVKGLLEKQYYIRATVIIGLDQVNKKRTLGRVYLVGQIRLNGPQEIPDDERFTLSKAILKAGGFSDFADRKKVRLVRGGNTNNVDKSTTVVNVADIWEKGLTKNDPVLEPDDLIFVPAKLVNF